MTRARLAWLMVGLVVVSAAAPAVLAQSPPPLSATLVLKDPPPLVQYPPWMPVALVLQLRNTTGAPIVTTEGFLATEFGRRLFFTSPTGGTIVNTAEAAVHADSRTFQCLSRRGVLLRPTAMPVVPVEVLEIGTGTDGFLREYAIDDARKYYDLSQPGRYSARALIPIQTIQTGPDSLIDDCDQLAGETLANVGSVTGRLSFTVTSNAIEFEIAAAPPPVTFSGFRRPLVDDASCPGADVTPCATFRVGRAILVDFRLALNGHPLAGTTVHIRLTKTDGTTVPLTPDTFRTDKRSGRYLYTLRTRSLSAGVWRLDAMVDTDLSVHSTHFGLR